MDEDQREQSALVLLLAQNERIEKKLDRVTESMARLVLDTKRSLSLVSNKTLRLMAMRHNSTTLAEDIPPEVLNEARQKQYKKRLAEMEAAQANGHGDPEPLPDPPVQHIQAHTHREPYADEITGLFSKEHRDGRERKFHEMIGAVTVFTLKRAWPFVLAALTAFGAHMWHAIHGK